MKAAFYQTKIDELQMIVSVNLDYKEEMPLAGKENCLELAVTVKPTTPREKRDRLMHELQFKLIDKLTTALDVAYVGRTSRPLQRNLYFYCAESMVGEIQEAASRVLADYGDEPVAMAMRHFHDDSWSLYADILMPTDKDQVEVAVSEDVIL